MSIEFSAEKDIQHKIAPCRNDLMKKLSNLLPCAKIEEIGSTAIPGAITKGDLDILVIVSDHEFPRAKSILGERYDLNDMDPKECFVSFKGLYKGVDFGIQLATPEFGEFNFVSFRDALIKSPELVKRYNKLKIESSGLTMDEYRENKYRFIESVISGNA